MMRLIKYILLLVVILLIRCTDDKTIDPDCPIQTKDYAELSIQLGKVVTKADDIPATNEEKKIESLACFVQTFDEGIIGQEGYKPGAFLKFFSHETKGSVDGFTDFDFNNDPPNVKMKIYSEGFKDLTQLVFIANYEQNGLKNDLMNVKRMEDLERICTREVTSQGIKYPLLMTGYAEVALSNQSVVTNVEVVMTRIMARIDIQNNANAGDKPFVLESAEVINPKLYSYLMDGNDDSYNIPVLDRFDRLQAGSTDKIEGLYTYETANDGSVEHTAILVRGTLKGETYAKRIDMHTAGQPVPLGRNKRYLITLNKTADNQDISFTFKINDWEDGSTFPVRPDHNKPVLEGVTFSNGFTQERWNESEMIYNMENQPSGRMTFSVTGKQQISAKVIETKSYVEGSTSNLEDMANIQVTDPVFNNDGTMTQTINIDIATAGILQNKEPVELYIQVYNVTKPNYNETICISTLLNYPGTTLKPVWLGGIYWAPINLGQTVLESSEVTTESVGHYFQWGRNTPFYKDAVPTIQGPISYASATGANSKNFIYVTSGDWLASTETAANINRRNSLWTNSNDTDNPCPSGWRIPKSTELETILNAYQSTNQIDISKCRFNFIGDDGQKLFFPFMGYIAYANGSIAIPTVTTYQRILLWAGDIESTMLPVTAARLLDILNRTNDPYARVSYSGSIAYGFAVRCIRR